MCHPLPWELAVLRNNFVINHGSGSQWWVWWSVASVIVVCKLIVHRQNALDGPMAVNRHDSSSSKCTRWPWRRTGMGVLSKFGSQKIARYFLIADFDRPTDRALAEDRECTSQKTARYFLQAYFAPRRHGSYLVHSQCKVAQNQHGSSITVAQNRHGSSITVWLAEDCQVPFRPTKDCELFLHADQYKAATMQHKE